MIGYLLESPVVENAFFLVISKSGATTSETLGQFYVLFEQVKTKLGAKSRRAFPAHHHAGRQSAQAGGEKEHGLKILDHAPDVGGRFSVLSNVGLLPGAVAGLDIKALRKGAQTVRCRKAWTMPHRPKSLPARHRRGMLQYACMENRLQNMSILMPYGELFPVRS